MSVAGTGYVMDCGVISCASALMSCTKLVPSYLSQPVLNNPIDSIRKNTPPIANKPQFFENCAIMKKNNPRISVKNIINSCIFFSHLILFFFVFFPHNTMRGCLNIRVVFNLRL